MRQLILIVFTGLFLSGCAFGNTHRYDLGDAEFDLNSENTVAVSVLDQRPYIVSGDKGPSFVGLMRSGVGIPYNINTSTGRPMAEDMTTSIVEALKKDDVDAIGVTVSASDGEDAARSALLAADSDRFALLLVREWKTDTYVNTGLVYDVTLEVLQPDGTTAAEKTMNGRDSVGSSLVPADARVNAEKAFKAKLEEAFGDPGIKSALQ